MLFQPIAPLSHAPRSQRQRRRIQVLFGSALSAPHAGVTVNVSPGGIAIAAPRVPRAGSALQLSLVDAQGQVVRARGVVAWAEPGAPDLGLQATMGVRLTHADPGFTALALGEVAPAGG